MCHGPASEMLSGHLPCSSANSWTESRPYRKQTSRLLGTTPPSSTKCRTSVPPESQASVVTNWPLRAPQGNCPSSLNCAASTPHWGPSTEKRGRHFPFFHQSLKTKPRTNLSLLQIVLTHPGPLRLSGRPGTPCPPDGRTLSGRLLVLSIWPPSPSPVPREPPVFLTHPLVPKKHPVFRKAGTFHQGQVDQHPLRPSERRPSQLNGPKEPRRTSLKSKPIPQQSSQGREALLLFLVKHDTCWYFPKGPASGGRSWEQGLQTLSPGNS